jgi:hypothetical protein
LTMNISIGLFVKLIVVLAIVAVVTFLASGLLDVLPF